MRVLADVREALADDVVRRHLDPLRQTPVERDRQSHRHGRTGGERLERDRQPMSADDRRMDARAPRRGAPPATTRSRFSPDRRQPSRRSRSRAALRAGRARATGQSAAAARRRGGCAPAAGAPSARPRSPARASPCSSSRRAFSSTCSRPFSRAMPAAALTASSSSGSSLARGRARAPPRALRRGRSASWCARRRRPAAATASAVEIGPALELRQPVRQRQRRIAQRAGERVAQNGGGGSARSSRSRSPTAERASRALRSPIRNASGASPITTKVALRIVSKAGTVEGARQAKGRRASRGRAQSSRPAAPPNGAAGGPSPAYARPARRPRSGEAR